MNLCQRISGVVFVQRRDQAGGIEGAPVLGVVAGQMVCTILQPLTLQTDAAETLKYSLSLADAAVVPRRSSSLIGGHCTTQSSYLTRRLARGRAPCIAARRPPPS